MSSYAFTHHDATRVVVDLSGQVISAEIAPLADLAQFRHEWQAQSADREPDDGIAVLDSSCLATLHPSVSAAGVDGSFTPLFALASKAKRFDDRLIAALEMLTHRGGGEHAGLYAVCSKVLERLAPGTNAHGLLDAARHLAEGSTPPLGGANIRTRKWFAAFLEDAAKSKPVGIYAGDEDLGRVFRHDRLLQSELTPDDAATIRAALEADPVLLDAYRAHLQTVTAVTGPLKFSPVTGAGARFAMFPTSDSIERRLFDELFANAPVPAGFELGQELVTRIRDGRIDTTPRAIDGWYAHQVHASAARLFPETSGLRVGPEYRSELESMFKALFALNRETHVKQLDVPLGTGAPPLLITPKLTVEPVPELYARTASAYRYLREQLTTLLGRHVLRSIELAEGLDIESGLVEMELLFHGAETVCRFELGQEEPADALTARTVFTSWQRRSGEDPDLDYDLRVAVPVWTDEVRDTVRICVTIGIETRTLELEFVERPTVTVFGGDAKAQFASSRRTILSPVTIECDVRKPPTREELRDICTREKTVERIRAALQA